MTRIRLPALAALAVIAALLGVETRLARAQPFELPVRLVRDINPGAPSSVPNLLTNVNGTLFFRATTPAAGQELWKSDGTTAGTVPVKDIRPGALDSNLFALTDVNGRLFFAATDGNRPAALR